MDGENLRNNFWKAGASGKRNNEVAQKAGVIGTFGIGAMANFGVCQALEVFTTPLNTQVTYYSKAERSNLRIGEECIDLEVLAFNGHIGTQIIATLDPSISFDFNSGIEYIRPYIEFLPISVIINDEQYSKKNYHKVLTTMHGTQIYQLPTEQVSSSGFNYKIEGYALQNSFVFVRITDLAFQQNAIPGDLILFQGATNCMCYRNYFGLSPIPVSNGYNLGGFINLSFLLPTAGREALSRDSLAILSNLLISVEHQITLGLAKSDISNVNISFQNLLLRKIY